MGLISQSICIWQGLPAQGCGQGQNLTLEGSTLRPPYPPTLGLGGKELHSRVGSWPYSQTLVQAGKTCQGQTLWLIRSIRKLQQRSSTLGQAPGLTRKHQTRLERPACLGQTLQLFRSIRKLQQRSSTLGKAPALLANIRLGWKDLPAQDKHSSLLGPFVY